MEVVCSLEDVARVLADNGYNLNDDSCFANAADLPSVLSALDSPDSFPESPCSDEDIARVLDIARMPSPSLLDSCTPSTTHPFAASHHNHQHHNHHQHHPHHHQLPITPTEEHMTYDLNIHKTRDPCITNAVLQNSLLPSFHPVSREPQSLDLFSIALNCSFQDDNASSFNNLVTYKDNDTFSNYFHSSSALSPVSETETIIPGASEPLSKNNISDPSHNLLDSQTSPNDYLTQSSEKNSQCRTSSHQASVTRIDVLSNINPKQNQDTISINSSQVNTAQTKRKRRRKSGHVTPKTKRRKQDKSNVTSDPKPSPNLKHNVNKKNTTKSNQGQTASKNNDTTKTRTEAVTKRKCANSNSGCRKSNRSKNNILSNLETISESAELGLDINKATSSHESSSGLDPTTIEIGSTNGRIEEVKGPRRSSRSTKNPENYNFRLSSLVKRVETERKQQEPKQPKGKVKPPPLSKYRRRTANARERDRMKEINDAFEVLKDTLPDMEPEEGKSKITKFTILKLALNYISSLQDILGLDPSQPYSETNMVGSTLELESQGGACDDISGEKSSCKYDKSSDQGHTSSEQDNSFSSLHDTPTHNEGVVKIPEGLAL